MTNDLLTPVVEHGNVRDSRRRILITGGAGFVGSQLGQRLARDGHEVILLDNMRFGQLDNLLMDGRPFGRFVCRDIQESADSIYDGVDCVFHLAGIAALPVCQMDPRAAYDVNVAGTGWMDGRQRSTAPQPEHAEKEAAHHALGAEDH